MIEAKIVADSIANGIRLCTIQTKAPKFLDAEFEKHRMISSNSSSDRAIPLLKMLDAGYFLPNDVRLNQPGMQGGLLLDGDSKEEFWNDLKNIYGYTSEKLKKWDRVHKQHLNRYLMGFSWQHKVITATEWDNFFNLRLNSAADPAMYKLSICMKEVMDISVPDELKLGEYHLPYVDWDEFPMSMFANKEDLLQTKIKCSIARCARVSYLNHDNSSTNVERDIVLADKLLEAGHMSPFEHIASPMEIVDSSTGEDVFATLHRLEGYTHVDRNGIFWSGNFRNWIQYRQLLQGN